MTGPKKDEAHAAVALPEASCPSRKELSALTVCLICYYSSRDNSAILRKVSALMYNMAALEDIGPVYTKSSAELTPHHHNTLHIFTCILTAEIILSSSVVVNQEVLSFFHFF